MSLSDTLVNVLGAPGNVGVNIVRVLCGACTAEEAVFTVLDAAVDSELITYSEACTIKDEFCGT